MGQENGYSQMQRGAGVRNAAEILSRTALIQGALALGCVILFPVAVPFILGSTALILAFLSRGYEKSLNTKARIAVGLSLGAILLNLLIILFSLFFFLLQYQTNPAFREGFEREFRRETGMEFTVPEKGGSL